MAPPLFVRVVDLSLRSRVSIVPDGDCRNCGLQGAESYCICMMYKMYMILARILKIFYPYHSRVLCVCGTTRYGKNSEVLGGSTQLAGLRVCPVGAFSVWSQIQKPIATRAAWRVATPWRTSQLEADERSGRRARNATTSSSHKSLNFRWRNELKP